MIKCISFGLRRVTILLTVDKGGDGLVGGDGDGCF